MSGPLTQAFLAACEPAIAARLGADRKLEHVLAKHVDAATKAWPLIPMDAEAFVAHIARRLRPEVDVHESLRALHGADLHLALAAGLGNRRALGALDKLIASLPDSLSRLASRAPLDEVIQTLRTKLFVTQPGGAPKILDYSGRGPLAGWLRVSAIRTALSLGRRADAAPADPVTRDVILGVPGLGDDPEILHLRERHKQDFKAAFEDAFRELGVQDRNVLRLSLVDGLSIDEIGALFHVHRATAARWIQRALDGVQSRTRALLAERLRLSSQELESLLGVLRSSIELSLQRLLQAHAEMPPPENEPTKRPKRRRS
jgi:RNA polymerase sigma-70 factor (ECF subfamily)